ncbi:MAG: proton-conducting transporter membrane subunit [Candidatus Margulisiibacteriota bacterium]
MIAVIAPFAAALLCLLFRRLAGAVALLAMLAEITLALQIFAGGRLFSPFLALQTTPLATAVFLAAALIGLLIVIYSLKALPGLARIGEYYAYLLITIGAAAGAFFAGDFFTLLFFWGVVAVALYLLVGIGGDKATAAAKKSLIIVGGADALMVLGTGLVWLLTRSIAIGPTHLPLNNPLTIIAFLALAAGAFAKAGVMPFHGWIPDSAEVAPAPVMALLPASLDKLLGIYLLARLSLDVFLIEPGSVVSTFLLAIGSVTILAAVLGALVQHDFRKLLAFHAVSQVGYMVMGIGTGLPIGVAGGLFHMFNNAIYKSCLFLCGGSVEKQAGTTDLAKLGGLAKFMPLTFTAFLVAALSISGVPPFNGFVSKWMIYQSLVELGRYGNNWWIVWLAAAMFGSAFTLASFMKLLHAIFLGQWTENTTKAKEVEWPMWLPTIILVALCLLFGLFAFSLPLKFLVLPTVGTISLTGWWQPGLATVMLLLGLVVGLFFYLIGKVGAVTTRPPFIGGELLAEEEIRVSGVDFYDSVQEWGPLNAIYKIADRRNFDLYALGSRGALALSGLLSWLHNGLLHTYLAWMLLGMMIILFLLMR